MFRFFSSRDVFYFITDGRKIGIIGYVTPETKQVSNSEDIIFLDEIEAVTKVNENEASLQL